MPYPEGMSFSHAPAGSPYHDARVNAFLPKDVRGDQRIVTQIAAIFRAAVEQSERLLSDLDDKETRLSCRSIVEYVELNLPDMDEDAAEIERAYWENVT